MTELQLNYCRLVDKLEKTEVKYDLDALKTDAGIMYGPAILDFEVPEGLRVGVLVPLWGDPPCFRVSESQTGIYVDVSPYNKRCYVNSPIRY